MPREAANAMAGALGATSGRQGRRSPPAPLPCVDGPFGASGLADKSAVGRVRSCVRPVARHLAAGPDGVRGPGSQSVVRGRCRLEAVEMSQVPGSTGLHHVSLHPCVRSTARCGGAYAVVAGPGAESFLREKHRPDDARELVGERDCDEARRSTLEQPIDPGRLGAQLAAPVSEKAGRPDHEQASDVTVALLRRPAEPVLAAAGSLARCEAEPGGELPAGSEERSIRHGRGDRARSDLSEPGDRRQALAGVTVSMPCPDLTPPAPWRSSRRRGAARPSASGPSLQAAGSFHPPRHR